MKNIAVFASGNGSNLKSIHRYVQLGEIPGYIVLVVSNNPSSGAIKYAEENQISTKIINKVLYPNPADGEETLLYTLRGNDVDLLCLAGYIKLLPEAIVQKYKDRILNIHPALLPQFGGKGYYGIKVHEAVIASGTEESGVTVHIVDGEYDHGKIIAQKKIEVRSEDTAEILAERALKVEHELYPYVIKAFCEDRIVWKNNHPIIEGLSEN